MKDNDWYTPEEFRKFELEQESKDLKNWRDKQAESLGEMIRQTPMIEPNIIIRDTSEPPDWDKWLKLADRVAWDWT